jgi:hypothetical protein
VFCWGQVAGAAAPPPTSDDPAAACPCLQLARLARALGRSLVVPNPPCDSDWVGVWRAEATDWLREKEVEATVPLWEEVVDGFQVGAEPRCAEVAVRSSPRLQSLLQVLRFPDTQRPGRTYCHWRRFIDRYSTPAPNPSPCFDPAAFVQHADAVAFLHRSISPEEVGAGFAVTVRSTSSPEGSRHFQRTWGWLMRLPPGLHVHACPCCCRLSQTRPTPFTISAG